MKTFTFKYDPKATVSSMFDRFKNTIQTGKVLVQHHEVRSNSVAALLSQMTAGRIELFYTIAQHKPESLYAAAQYLKRDQANVLRDAKALESIGLISLVPEKDGARDRLRPLANYDRVVFDFGAVKNFNAA